jgi:Fe-S cluster assembly iron-binding protein IscA
MKVTFDEKTKEALEKKLNEFGKSAVRFMIQGFGWGGPTLGVVLDEQKLEDTVEIVDGITFVVDKEEDYIFEDCSVVYTKTLFGDSFKVISAAVGESTCG